LPGDFKAAPALQSPFHALNPPVLAYRH